MSKIFRRLGLKQKQLYEILAFKGDTEIFNRLRPGQDLKFKIYEDKIMEIFYQIDIETGLSIKYKDGKVYSEKIIQKLKRRLTKTSSTIDKTLFSAAREAGLSNKMALDLARIFGWDIDFVLDIRRGDSFTLIYEEFYKGRENIRDGAILAAEFKNKGNVFTAVRYTDETGRSEYYTPEGGSMRKAFLRSPIDVPRVSSRFNLKRRHPILKRTRPHRGVDYSAPLGTPVMATSGGIVAFKNKKGSYGRTVMIKHGTKYSTLYAHLSGYARSMEKGKLVKQGQIIGYVGMSGLASGPHLHYEFRAGSIHRDPLKIDLPSIKNIPSRLLADFKNKTRELVNQLSGRTRITLMTQ